MAFIEESTWELGPGESEIDRSATFTDEADAELLAQQWEAMIVEETPPGIPIREIVVRLYRVVEAVYQWFLVKVAQAHAKTEGDQP